MRDTWTGFSRPKFKYICNNRECGLYYLCDKCAALPENQAILEERKKQDNEYTGGEI